jgi:hypothetical protein
MLDDDIVLFPTKKVAGPFILFSYYLMISGK